ncbi:MAG: SGNH/GDSL hydrolase family protein [Candidatus Omnitrophica bacterium]|nr:SGNH/GDSL hydrolase family protein [Candidatus Omnitrophota bacterium]
MEEKIEWFCPKEKPFEIKGFAWFDKEKLYRRLPEKPSYKIPEAVDYLANNTAGGVIRFKTDSKSLWIRVKLRELVNMPHMPATAHSGFDCYIGKPRKETYLTTAIFVGSIEYEKKLFQFEKKEKRDITLYFPLYNGVNEVHIGIDPDAKIFKPEPFPLKGRIVIYGTSITQGGCASRPGMAYTNILSRWIGIELINLGFSGSGKGEPELANLITMIKDVRCIILDYQANAGIDGYISTLPEFVKILRSKFRDIPLIIISRPGVSGWFFDRKTRNSHMKAYRFQEKFVKELRRQGDRKIFSYNGTELFRDMWQESTVDGVHPTDLGFMTMAKALHQVIKSLKL